MSAAPRPSTDSRSALRRQLRARRRALSPDERRAAAYALTARLASLPLFRRARSVALYLPNDGELDPTPLIQLAWRMGKRVYLPILAPGRTPHLRFAPYHPHSALRRNRFGIPEPITSRRQGLRPAALDLVLTPLVAFDGECNRLGMGGGYYDRSFAFLHHRRHWQHPRLLGLAYAFQRVDGLEHQPWDVPLFGVATDAGLALCSR